jgi:hypothetical protein
MTIGAVDKIKPLGSFKVVDAGDVEVSTDLQFVSLAERKKIDAAATAASDIATLGKNLVNMNSAGVQPGFFISASNGVPTANAAYIATDFVPVAASTQYTRSFANQMAFYDAGKVFISGLTNEATFVTPANAAYARFTVPAGGTATFQVEFGGAATAYEAYGNRIKPAALANTPASILADRSLSLAKTTFAAPGKNLFNPADADVVLGNYVSSASGAVAANAAYNATGFMAVVAGQTYSRSSANQGAWLSAAKAFLAPIATADGLTIVAPAGAAYARLSVATGSWATFQFELGAAPTSYVPFGFVIDAAVLPPVVLPDSSVTLAKTTFVTPGKNLFNPNDPDVAAGYFVSSAGGGLAANANYIATGYIPVVAGQTYSRSFANQMAWFTAAKAYISGQVGGDGATVTAPANAAYARLSVSTAALPAFQFEKGSAPTAYEAYKLILDPAYLPPVEPVQAVVPDDSVTLAKVSFKLSGKNLFNPNDAGVSPGYFVSSAGGGLSANAAYTATGYIPVQAGQQYARNYSNQMAWFTAAKAFISGQSTADGAIVTAPANAAFARLTVAAANVSTFQFEKGAAVTSFEAYGKSYLDPVAFPPVYADLPAQVNRYLYTSGLPKKGIYGGERLRRTHSALAMIQRNDPTIQFHWVQEGDSWTHVPARYSGVSAADLFSLPYAGDAGFGWTGAGYYNGSGKNGNARDSLYTVTRSGTWVDTDGVYYNGVDTPDLASAYTTTVGSKYTFTGPDAALVEAIEQWWLGTADGVTRYRWNGGAWTAQNVQGAGLQFGSLLTGKPASGAWTLEVELVAGAWQIAGILGTNSQRGIRVSKCAGSGSRLQQWAARGADWRTGLARLAPDLVSFMLLTNDRSANRTPTQFAADATTLLTNIRAAIPSGPAAAVGATPAPDILLMMPPETVESGRTYGQPAYMEAIYPVADQFGAAVIDFQQIFGAPGTYTGWLTADMRHPDVPMSRLIADTVTKVLTNHL